MFGHIWNNIILLNLNEFANIDIDIYINLLFLAIAVAIIVIAFLFDFSRGITYTAVKQLVRHEANDENSAKTLSELGLSKSKFVRFMLSGAGELTRAVLRVGSPKIDYDSFMKLNREERKKLFLIDFDTETFYLSEEGKKRADRILSRYEFSIPRFVAFAVFVILIWGAVCAFSYEIFSYINSIIISK